MELVLQLILYPLIHHTRGDLRHSQFGDVFND